MDKWKALENKAAWISYHLENEKSIAEDIKEPAKKNLLEYSKGPNLCKIHGLPLTAYGKCLQKGCKYA